MLAHELQMPTNSSDFLLGQLTTHTHPYPYRRATIPSEGGCEGERRGNEGGMTGGIVGELWGNVRGVETRGNWAERPHAVGSWWKRSGNAGGMGRIPHFDLMESGWDQGGIAGGICKTVWRVFLVYLQL